MQGRDAEGAQHLHCANRDGLDSSQASYDYLMHAHSKAFPKGVDERPLLCYREIFGPGNGRLAYQGFISTHALFDFLVEVLQRCWKEEGEVLVGALFLHMTVRQLGTIH